MTGGGDALCSGLPHGIRHATEDGQEYFYHANVGGAGPADRKLAKTTLDGTIVWQVNGTFGQNDTRSYRPTWFGIPPSGPYVRNPAPAGVAGLRALNSPPLYYYGSLAR